MSIKTEMTITAPEGQMIDQEAMKEGRVEFIPIEKRLPRSWGELGEIEGECVHTEDSSISFGKGYPITQKNRNIVPKGYGEPILTLGMLLQLRDRYNDGWVPDWNDNSSKKFTITINDGNILKDWRFNASRILSFKTKSLRDKFLAAPEIYKLIEIAKPLL